MTWKKCSTPLFLAAVVPAVLCGCTKDDDIGGTQLYLPQTSERNVINNLEVAYKRKEILQYAKLLSEDFQFFFDEQTRIEHPELPPFITKLEDSTLTHGLFESPKVTDIRIDLTFDDPRSPDEIGREGQTLVEVIDTFLEVDQIPEPGEQEGVTLRVDGQIQYFYFRKGRVPNPGPTDTLYYLVDWRDFGMVGKVANKIPAP